jgi:hypothetical protein
VPFHRGLADEEVQADFLVALVTREQGQHSQFPAGPGFRCLCLLPAFQCSTLLNGILVIASHRINTYVDHGHEPVVFARDAVLAEAANIQGPRYLRQDE